MTLISITNSWIQCLCPNPQARLRLFCFPYAGGGVWNFRTWAEALPKTLEVYAIALPGRGKRFTETAFTQLAPLVDAIASAIIPYLDKSFAFFGHSMGGLVSFELARLLRRNAQCNPVHLFVSGRRAPQLPATDKPIHALSDPKFLQEIRRLNGTPNTVLENAELMQLMLPTLRADFTLLETYVYRYEPPLSCPITTFGGLQDSEVSVEALEAWCEQTSATFSLKMLPGDHFFLHFSQFSLMQLIRQELNQAIA
ncbi:MAG: thioesterase II family protein [Leptolyngbyaceae cyanobacterium]